MSDVVDRPSSPEEQAALDAARAKLDQMTGRSSATPQQQQRTPPAWSGASRVKDADVPPGRVTSTPGAAAMAAERDAKAEVPAAEKRRLELTNELIHNKKLTEPERAEKLRELQAVLDEQMTDDEKAQTITLGELQDQLGIKPWEAPEGVEYDFNPEQEGEVLLFLSDNHVKPELIREMYEDFAGRMPGFGGDPTTQEQIDNWKSRFAKRLPAGMADKLVAWWLETEKANRGS